MPKIDREHRIGINIVYNGYTHSTWGLLEADDKDTIVHVFLPELPKGYRLEHGEAEMVIQLDGHCAVRDPTGPHGWRATEEFDLDEWAGKQTKTD